MAQVITPPVCTTPATIPCLSAYMPGSLCFKPADTCFGFFSANSTIDIIPGGLCTRDICPLNLGQAHFTYDVNLLANILVAAVFALILVSQIGLAIRYKTWGFLGGMVGGLGLEIIGYYGRIMIHTDPFSKNPFLIYLVCLTIGPAFLSASIYLCLARIVVAYGENLSRFKPRTYTITFMSCDFLSLLLQAVGGAIASIAVTVPTEQLGINIMIAGLAFQVASLALFMVFCADFAFQVRKGSRNTNPDFDTIRSKRTFQGFLIALAVATITIFVRSTYRVAELQQGFHGALANNEVGYMIAESLMIITATAALTAFHPGVAFGGKFKEANFSVRGRKSPRQAKLESIQSYDMGNRAHALASRHA